MLMVHLKKAITIGINASILIKCRECNMLLTNILQLFVSFKNVVKSLKKVQKYVPRTESMSQNLI